MERPLPIVEHLRDLVQRAQEGDHTVLPELRKALDGDPSLWQTYGDLAAQAQASWLHLLAGNDLMLQESVAHKLDEMRTELGDAGSSPLEKLLIERVLACWVQTCYSDASYAQSRDPKASPAVLRELQHRQDSSQRRLLDAIKKLALVRKLLRPSVSPLQLAAIPVDEGPVPRHGRKSLRGVPVAN